MAARGSTGAWLAAAAVLALAVLLRTAALGVDGLWVDEIFGASYVNLGWGELVLAVLRFDIHPPLYYLQLKLWALPAAGDGWLLANSVAWSLAALVLAAAGVARMAGAAGAFVTLCLGAVLGSEVHFASELRMYAMLSCLAVAGWWAARRWAAEPGRAATLQLVAVLAALSLVHSAAFVAISCVLLYALAEAQARQGGATALRRLLLPAGAAALLLAPWLALGSLRTLSHTRAPDAEVIAGTLAGWLLGYGGVAFAPALRWAAAAAVLLFVAALLAFASPPVRRIAACFIAWPVLFVGAVSLLLRPIWLDRTLAFCAPFLAISAGCVLQPLVAQTRWRWLPLVALGLAGPAWAQAQQPRKMQYRELAQALAAANAAHRPIHAPVNTAFWGVARYLAGPRWGSLLAIQDPVAADSSSAWARVYARLGPARLQALGLVPRTRELATPAGPLFIGATPLPAEVTAGGFWRVGDAGAASEPQPCAPGDVAGVQRLRGLTLLQCTGGRP